jgi:hypothetical protein
MMNELPCPSNCASVRLRILAILLLFFFVITCHASAADKPQEVTIPAGKYQLHGCFWTPEGPGPYPVMIFKPRQRKEPCALRTA